MLCCAVLCCAYAEPAVPPGMYQKDLKAAALKTACADAVESCVHWAGVDLNTASSTLLQHVGGVGPKTAQAIVRSREVARPFQSRLDLLERKLLRPKLFEQAAGFLRVTGAGSPALDATEVHPNDYNVATQLLMAAGLPTDTLQFGEKAAAGRKAAFDVLLAKLLPGHVSAGYGANDEKAGTQMVEILGTFAPVEVVNQIVGALCRSFVDPREAAPPPVFRQDVLSLSDVSVGMDLTGVVRNEVDFGWFVDCGLGEDGLLHTSAVNSAQCLPPSIGDVIAVTATSVDVARGRLGLTLQHHHVPTPSHDGAPGSSSGDSRGRHRKYDNDEHSDRPAKRVRSVSSSSGLGTSRGSGTRGHSGRGGSTHGNGVQARGGGRSRGVRRGSGARGTAGTSASAGGRQSGRRG